MRGSPSGKIFLSYRREDAAPYARLLQVQLTERIPDARVFMDLDSIDAGLDFAEVIREAVDSCAVLVALIGRQWATLADEEGRRRLDNSDDYVRFEIQTALERGVRVIPVLVDGAKPLRQEQLPSGLQKLARLNALELSYGRYRYDADRLVDLIQQVLASRVPGRGRRYYLVAALVGLVVIISATVAGFMLFGPASGSCQPGRCPAGPSPGLPSPPPGVRVTDQTGAVSVLVPKSWGDVVGDGWHPQGVFNGTLIGPGLNASPNNGDWFNDLTTPGIFVGASKLLVADHYDPLSSLSTFASPCDFSSMQSAASNGLTGYQDTWTCPHSTTRFETVALWPRNHSFIAFIELKIVTPADEASGKRALASLSIRY